jgi:hypothetical protein
VILNQPLHETGYKKYRNWGEVNNMYWISIKELRAISQKSNYGYDVYPLMFRFIRLISIYFTWLLIQTRCKPNTITILGVILGVLSGVMFFLGFVGVALALVTLAVIADFSDGEVSRFHSTTSKEGTYLDSIHHYVVQPFFIAGIVLWSFNDNQNQFFLAAGMICVINSIVLTLAVTSAVDNALLKHLLRYIKTNGSVRSPAKKVDAFKPEKQKKIFYRTIPGTIARMMDFPYVIVIMGIGAALIHYGDASIFNIYGKILVYIIYAYAFLSTCMTSVFIWNVVHSKHIEKRLNETIEML